MYMCVYVCHQHIAVWGVGIWSLHSSMECVCVAHIAVWGVCEHAHMCGLHIAVWGVCVCGLYVAVWGVCVCDLHITVWGVCVCESVRMHARAHNCGLHIAVWAGWLPENLSTALYNAGLQVCAQQGLALYVGAENLNWGSHASVVRTQHVSHLPSPQNSHFKSSVKYLLFSATIQSSRNQW